MNSHPDSLASRALKHPVESYLEELAAVRASGAATKETSGYPALANLFNAIGPSLKPKVRCLIQLTNSGAGLPDGGFFTPEQLKNSDEAQPLLGQKPSRLRFTRERNRIGKATEDVMLALNDLGYAVKQPFGN